eukprot:gene34884-45142_t
MIRNSFFAKVRPLFMRCGTIRRSVVDAHSAAISEIRELLQQLSESQLQTENILKTFIEYNQKSQLETANSLKTLIKYNQNRDCELEDIIGETFFGSLLAMKWEIERVPVRIIYQDSGVCHVEWDGVYFATHISEEFPRLYFIETKQILTLKKYVDAKRRLYDTRLLLESINFDDKAATGVHKNFLKMKSTFRRFFTSPLKPKIELVVGSPVI